jgi:hypothetical protein
LPVLQRYKEEVKAADQQERAILQKDGTRDESEGLLEIRNTDIWLFRRLRNACAAHKRSPFPLSSLAQRRAYKSS